MNNYKFIEEVDSSDSESDDDDDDWDSDDGSYQDSDSDSDGSDYDDDDLSDDYDSDDEEEYTQVTDFPDSKQLTKKFGRTVSKFNFEFRGRPNRTKKVRPLLLFVSCILFSHIAYKMKFCIFSLTICNLFANRRKWILLQIVFSL